MDSTARGEHLTMEIRAFDKPNQIDVAATHKNGKLFELALVVDEPWDIDPTTQLRKLGEKLNNYAEFILGGQMHRQFPDSIGRSIQITIAYESPLPEAVIVSLNNIAKAFKVRGIAVESYLMGSRTANP